MQQPVIIWTFRRTGGTNFGDALFDQLSYDAIQHEPFNRDRVFGWIFNRWSEQRDETELNVNIESVLVKKPLIKHCLEIFPPRFNRALAEASSKVGYRHVFLYRKRPINRLLSLHFATATGVWGRKQLDTYTLDPAIFDRDIPIKDLVEHELACREKMMLAFNALNRMGCQPATICFEDLYSEDREFSLNLIERVFEDLVGLDSMDQQEMLGRIANSGAQGSNDLYMRFRNSDEFVSEVSRLSEFKLPSKEQNEARSSFE